MEKSKHDQELLEKWEAEDRARDHKPYPKELENGEIICPICGAKVWRSPEVLLPRFKIYTYYCSKCDYDIKTRVFYEKSQIDPKIEATLIKLRQEYESKRSDTGTSETQS